MTLSLNVKQRISTFPCQISASSASHSKLAANLVHTFYIYSYNILSQNHAKKTQTSRFLCLFKNHTLLTETLSWNFDKKGCVKKN